MTQLSYRLVVTGDLYVSVLSGGGMLLFRVPHSAGSSFDPFYVHCYHKPGEIRIERSSVDTNPGASFVRRMSLEAPSFLMEVSSITNTIVSHIVSINASLYAEVTMRAPCLITGQYLRIAALNHAKISICPSVERLSLLHLDCVTDADSVIDFGIVKLVEVGRIRFIVNDACAIEAIDLVASGGGEVNMSGTSLCRNVRSAEGCPHIVVQDDSHGQAIFNNEMANIQEVESPKRAEPLDLDVMERLRSESAEMLEAATVKTTTPEPYTLLESEEPEREPEPATVPDPSVFPPCPMFTKPEEPEREPEPAKVPDPSVFPSCPMFTKPADVVAVEVPIAKQKRQRGRTAQPSCGGFRVRRERVARSRPVDRYVPV